MGVGPGRSGAAIIAATALAACSPPPPAERPPAPPKAPAPPAPATGADFRKPINAVGTEPFWAAELRPGRMKLSGPDRPDLDTSSAAPRFEGASIVFEGAASDGVALKVTLAPEACSDGMSDLSYPFTARVETGTEVLTGCAAPVDAWPRQPG